MVARTPTTAPGSWPSQTDYRNCRGVTNKLLAIGGIAVLVVGFALLMMPASIPLLDANRQVLAETPREGLCAGKVYFRSKGRGDEAAMKDCLSLEEGDNSPNYRQVQSAFCRGVIDAGLPIAHTQCQDVMESNRLWPTMTGTLTQSWNRRFPYPLSELGVPRGDVGGDESRTGEREGNERNGVGRE